MYAITQMILEVIGEDRARWRQWVDRLGYRNSAKGLRRLDELLTTGRCPAEFAARLREVLPVTSRRLDTAWAETRRQLELERQAAAWAAESQARADFRPHLWRLHERSRPHNITAVAFFGVSRWKRLFLPPDLPERPWVDQLAEVRAAIRGELDGGEDCGRSQFGSLLGYVYRPRYDHGILFSPAGEVLDPHYGPVREPRVEVTDRRGRPLGPDGDAPIGEDELEE